jgi:integrase
LLGAYGSLRWSELVAVKRDDLDLEGRSVRIDEKMVEVGGRFEWGPPKTDSSERVVDLPNLVIKPLAEHLLRFPPLMDAEDNHHRGLVFYGERGGPVRRHVFRPLWDAACLEAKVEPIRLEWLRHTGASIAYRATHDMKAVANRLGHTSVRMLDTTYVKVYADAAREVADALGMPLPRTSRGLSADSSDALPKPYRP